MPGAKPAKSHAAPAGLAVELLLGASFSPASLGRGRTSAAAFALLYRTPAIGPMNVLSPVTALVPVGVGLLQRGHVVAGEGGRLGRYADGEGRQCRLAGVGRGSLPGKGDVRLGQARRPAGRGAPVIGRCRSASAEADAGCRRARRPGRR